MTPVTVHDSCPYAMFVLLHDGVFAYGCVPPHILIGFKPANVWQEILEQVPPPMSYVYVKFTVTDEPDLVKVAFVWGTTS